MAEGEGDGHLYRAGRGWVGEVVGFLLYVGGMGGGDGMESMRPMI